MGRNIDDVGAQLLWRRRRQLDFARVADGPGVLVGDRVNRLRVGQFLEYARSENLVQLIRVQPDRVDSQDDAVGFLFEVAQRLIDRRMAGAVGRAPEVGQDNAGVRQVAAIHPDEQVRERRRRDHIERRSPDRGRPRCLEVGRQLVEEEQDRFAAQQVDPVLVARWEEWLIEVVESREAVELLRDLAPDAQRRVRRPPTEGDDANGPERAGGVESGHHLGAKARILCEETKRDEVVSLAAAHRLAK